MNLEQIVFSIISSAGNAKSSCFEALKYAKQGKFNDSTVCMEKAKSELLRAHHIQMGMIQREASGQKQDVTLLLMHAEDHLMAAILAKDLIEEMIDLYKKGS